MILKTDRIYHHQVRKMIQLALSLSMAFFVLSCDPDKGKKKNEKKDETADEKKTEVEMSKTEDDKKLPSTDYTREKQAEKTIYLALDGVHEYSSFLYDLPDETFEIVGPKIIEIKTINGTVPPTDVTGVVDDLVQKYSDFMAEQKTKFPNVCESANGAEKDKTENGAEEDKTKNIPPVEAKGGAKGDAEAKGEANGEVEVINQDQEQDGAKPPPPNGGQGENQSDEGTNGEQGENQSGEGTLDDTTSLDNNDLGEHEPIVKVDLPETNYTIKLLGNDLVYNICFDTVESATESLKSAAPNTAQEISMRKIVSVAPGKTKLKRTSIDYSNNKPVVTEIDIIVEQGSPELWDLGDTRYNNDNGLGGNSRPCATCHLSKKQGATSHLLGTLANYADGVIHSWMTEGKGPTGVASIPHTWEFTSDAEKMGTILYLRSLVSADGSKLIEAWVAREKGEFKYGISGPPEAKSTQ